MPLGPGVRYRWKKNPDGTKIRLAFRGNKVIETKKKGGKAHKVGKPKNLRNAVLRARAS